MNLPLILLPGMMCDARLFAPQLAVLGRDRALHLAPIGSAETMEQIAADVLRHAPPRFALAGLSMGGIVAMEVVRQAPERVERLALLDTNPLAEQHEMRARRGPQIEKVLAGGLAEVMRDAMKPNYLAGGPRRGEILDLCMEMALDLGPDVFARQSRALETRPDQSETLRRYGGPALVMCGREDKLCPVERHELMHRLLPASHLHVVEGAGHLPVLEEPADSNLALQSWLAR